MKAFIGFALLEIALVVPQAAHAQEHSTLSVTLDNDSFIHHIDRHYTNGLHLGWTSAPESRDDDVAAIAGALMLPGKANAQWRTGYFAGQSMFTPTDLHATVPDPRDRPYAGWLYAGAQLFRDSGDTLDKIDLTLGIVGPSALASDLQQSWHRMGLLGGIYPNGWHYQLHGEPGVILGEQRIWRVSLTDSDSLLEAELLPQANVRLGNIYTYGGAGAMLRVGSGLKADWGPPRIAPGQTGADFTTGDAFGWYVFGGFEGRAVARNLFLDGNSFEDSARVGHKALVGDLTAGAALVFPGVRVLAAYTNRSREFAGQPDNDQFVSISVSVAN